MRRINSAVKPFCFWSPLFIPHDQQHDAAHERNGTEDRRQGNGFRFLGSHLDRTEIDDLLSGCIRDALVSERHDA